MPQLLLEPDKVSIVTFGYPDTVNCQAVSQVMGVWVSVFGYQGITNLSYADSLGCLSHYQVSHLSCYVYHKLRLVWSLIQVFADHGQGPGVNIYSADRMSLLLY